LYKSFRSFSQFTVCVGNYFDKRKSEKDAHKMLVKLTLGFLPFLFLYAVFGITALLSGDIVAKEMIFITG